MLTPRLPATWSSRHEAYERLAEIITIVADGGNISQTAQRHAGAPRRGFTAARSKCWPLRAYPDNSLGGCGLCVSPTTVRNQMSQYLRLGVRTALPPCCAPSGLHKIFDYFSDF
jgi:hypothetical protein